MSKTKTVTGKGSGNETYTLNFTGADNLNVSGSTFNISSLWPATVTAKITGMATSYGTCYGWGEAYLYFNTTSYRDYVPNTSDENVAWTNGATKTLTYGANKAATLNTSSFFNSNNPTAKSVTVNYTATYRGSYYTANGGGRPGTSGSWNATNQTLTLGQTITLKAPPTFSVSAIKLNTKKAYANLTKATVTVSSLSAKYGGNISSVVLTIGNQKATRTTNGDLSINLNAVGTFPVTVVTTDSRGQSTTQSLGNLTVEEYVAPEVYFSLQRTTQSGVIDENGAYALITARFNYTNNATNLLEPTVKVDNSAITPTWYTDNRLSTPVNWSDTSSMSSPQTLYTLIGTFDTYTTYQIGITPRDGVDTGLEVTEILSGNFIESDFNTINIALKYKTNQNSYESLYPIVQINNIIYNRNNLSPTFNNIIYPHINLSATNISDALTEIDNKIAQCGRVFNKLEFGANKNINVLDYQNRQVTLSDYIIGKILYAPVFKKYYMLLYSVTYNNTILLTSADGLSWTKYDELNTAVITDMNCNSTSIYYLGYTISNRTVTMWKASDDTLHNLTTIYNVGTVSALPTSKADIQSNIATAFNLDDNSIIVYSKLNYTIQCYRINKDGTVITTPISIANVLIQGNGKYNIQHLRTGEYIIYNNSNSNIAQYVAILSDSYISNNIFETSTDNIAYVSGLMIDGSVLVIKYKSSGIITLYKYFIEKGSYFTPTVITTYENNKTLYLKPFIQESGGGMNINCITNIGYSPNVNNASDDYFTKAISNIEFDIFNSSNLYSQTNAFRALNTLYIYNDDASSSTGLYYSQIKM